MIINIKEIIKEKLNVLKNYTFKRVKYDQSSPPPHIKAVTALIDRKHIGKGSSYGWEEEVRGKGGRLSRGEGYYEMSIARASVYCRAYHQPVVFPPISFPP